MWLMKYVLRAEDDGQGGDLGGDAAAVDTGGQAAASAASAATAAPAAATASPSLLGGAGATAAATASAETKSGDWPADWRKLYAGSDDKLLKQMERYSSPKAALDSLLALKQKLSKGDFQKVLGENPSEDELKEWRTQNGVPDKPEEYKLEPGDGRVIGEADKPLVTEFLKNMHNKNATPGQVNDALQAYYNMRDAETVKLKEQDDTFHRESQDALMAEFGDDYDRNLNLVGALFSEYADEGLKTNLLGARLADGTALSNNPDVVRFLVALSREINPTAALVPGTSGNLTAALSDELSVIDKMMRDDPPGSRRKYDSDKKYADRWMQLTEASEKTKRRA